MFDRILVVCDGNICRSPTAAAMFRASAPGKSVDSAGLVALEGQDMDEMARHVAENQGLFCSAHSAVMLDRRKVGEADIVFVMESRQREKVIQLYPEASGKIFLLGHWLERKDIPDPYKRGQEAFERIYTMMRQAVDAWLVKI